VVGAATQRTHPPRESAQSHEVNRAPVIRPAAQAEIDQQAAYLAENASEAIAHRFLAAVEETIARIA
jgi:hypothetical protein